MTVGFAKVSIKGEGDYVGWFGLVHPCHPAALWIDESLMNLYEILGFQPKGVATLSFSSRKRPAYAGMTGTAQYDGPGGRFVLFHPHL